METDLAKYFTQGIDKEMIRLAAQVAEQIEERLREDIESWAEQLADDVSKAVD